MREYTAWAVERAMKVQQVVLKAMSGEINWLTAAEILGISARSMYRWKERYREYGYDGLFDRRAGKPSPKRVPMETVERVLRLYREKYSDCSVRHFHEKLEEVEGIGLSYTWVKTALQTAGLARKTRKRGPHRKRRPRKPLPGILLHIDGSPHRWLGDGRYYDLIVVLDDATNEVYWAELVEEENTRTLMKALAEVIRRRGLFCSLYTDRASHFTYTRQAGQAPERGHTQIERALDQLGIELILARSPQARGRSERNFRTWQGRLPQELRARGIQTLAAANAFLEREYVQEFNRRFAVTPAESDSAFVPFSGDLDRYLCIQEERTVGNDNTVRLGSLILQIEPQKFRFSLAKRRALVCRHLDDTITVRYGPHVLGRYSATGELLDAPERRRTKRTEEAA